MRDALRAVLAVMGAFAVLLGGIGVFRGWLTRLETAAVAVGLVLILVVALIPPGKPAGSVYEDRNEENW